VIGEISQDFKSTPLLETNNLAKLNEIAGVADPIGVKDLKKYLSTDYVGIFNVFLGNKAEYDEVTKKIAKITHANISADILAHIADMHNVGQNLVTFNNVFQRFNAKIFEESKIIRTYMTKYKTINWGVIPELPDDDMKAARAFRGDVDSDIEELKTLTQTCNELGMNLVNLLWIANSPVVGLYNGVDANAVLTSNLPCEKKF
jgi:hypothetical protein